ncbi:acyl-CoA dehydrogenase [Streptomyces viridochromogenes]|uniref:Acyl-CoA dehydrogenase n=1 Tax=Streptomyces viridochromogenes TaxID=1938 RepID=A0A0J7ZMF1_STRVR|nr:acyl-CoA dehydrogenase family protein [Streptomyces viridochromogenes]KMS76278.1 acyl-CoA dehydrogenase [Streptomyces viridochromogenes]KOG20390.1 acyl-CoA dehydrogenase [Streptomyces viridochromogenes]KOG22232.1 acyl-CoA dehydrogenase [Streptomyces viridochromogenes]
MTSAPPADEAAEAGARPVDWPHTARELADDLATDAVEREQAGKPPLDEVARLRESGLLTLLVPAALGGGGADWRTAYTVVRTVAAADGAIGHLLGSHYFLSHSVRFFAGPDRAARVERASAAGEWYWGGGIASQEPPLMLTPTTDGFLLDGHQRYGSGVGVADRLVVRAAVPGTGEPLAVLVDTAHPGLVSGNGGDTFGQRLAAAGGVGFDSVPVAADDVLGSLSADDGALAPFTGLAVPTARLVSAHCCLGAAEGLLGEVREHGRAAQSAWQPFSPQPWPGSPPQDPYVLTAYGELAVAARAASALADQAVAALTRGLGRGEDLDDEECAEIAVLASAAEAAASRAAQEISTHALDAVGVPAAFARHGLDRFWRDTRTHTLREPVAHRLREVGDYFLNGAHPPFSLPA